MDRMTGSDGSIDWIVKLCKFDQMAMSLEENIYKDRVLEFVIEVVSNPLI